MESEEPTFVYAYEIEAATINALWHFPQWLPAFMRRIDPIVHISQPHLRIILEALNLAYGELGTCDFAIVVTVVRELGQFEECGGLDGLNAVYSMHESSACNEIIYRDYVQMLETYARNRAQDPPQRVHRLTGGRATLPLNKNKRRQSDPNFHGEIKVGGKLYRVVIFLAAEAATLTLVPK